VKIIDFLFYKIVPGLLLTVTGMLIISIGVLIYEVFTTVLFPSIT